MAIIGLTLLGCGLRFAYLNEVAVEHFDEGVYASNIWCEGFSGDAYPMRYLYAPPLVPAMIREAILFGGQAQFVPLLPALLFGVLTVPLIYLTGRRWFGSVAGFTAATLAALSDFHMLYSRTALTDVPLLFWLLLAVSWFERSLNMEGDRWRRHLGAGRAPGETRQKGGRAGYAVLAGIATGVAWWIKYNGWLPIAIAVSGGSVWWIFETVCAARRRARPAADEHPPSDAGSIGHVADAASVRVGSFVSAALRKARRTAASDRPPGRLERDDDLDVCDVCELEYDWPAARRAGRLLWHLTLMIAAAAAVWSPVWFDLGGSEGYSEVATNHGRYLVGLSGWPDGLLRQVANHAALDDGLSRPTLVMLSMLLLTGCMVIARSSAHRDFGAGLVTAGTDSDSPPASFDETALPSEFPDASASPAGTTAASPERPLLSRTRPTLPLGSGLWRLGLAALLLVAITGMFVGSSVAMGLMATAGLLLCLTCRQPVSTGMVRDAAVATATGTATATSASTATASAASTATVSRGTTSEDPGSVSRGTTTEIPQTVSRETGTADTGFVSRGTNLPQTGTPFRVLVDGIRRLRRLAPAGWRQSDGTMVPSYGQPRREIPNTVVGTRVSADGLCRSDAGEMEWFERCGSGRIAPWLLAAWFVGLLLATPLYYPYPRLTLPWLAAAWLGTGGLFEVVNRRSLFRAARHGVSGRRVLGHGEFVHPTPSMAVTCGVLGLLSCLAAATCANHGATGRGMLRDSSAWQLRTGMAQVATNIAEQLPADGRATCYVFGEPALFFHLRRLDIAAVPVADLSFAVPRQRAGPTDFSAAPGMYLAIGSHAHSSPAFRQQWESVAWRFEKIKDIFWLPGDLVLLDESAPESDRRRAGRIEQVVTLYRIRPGIRR